VVEAPHPLLLQQQPPIVARRTGWGMGRHHRACRRSSPTWAAPATERCNSRTFSALTARDSPSEFVAVGSQASNPHPGWRAAPTSPVVTTHSPTSPPRNDGRLLLKQQWVWSLYHRVSRSPRPSLLLPSGLDDGKPAPLSRRAIPSRQREEPARASSRSWRATSDQSSACELRTPWDRRGEVPRPGRFGRV